MLAPYEVSVALQERLGLLSVEDGASELDANLNSDILGIVVVDDP